MTERLPRVVYDRLAKSIWDLGRASMAHIVSIAPAPSRIKGEVVIDDEVLEPEFLVTDPERFDRTMPDIVGLTINTAEEFAQNPDFTLYTWRRVMLDRRHRTREYDQGVTLLSTAGESIAPQLDMPVRGRRRRRGTQEWRDFKSETNIDVFDVQTAEEFIEMSIHFREHIIRER